MRGANFAPREPLGGVTMIVYRDQVAATAGSSQVFLAPHIADQADDAPERAFVSMMAVYAMRVREGSAPGPYSHERAALFARLVLMDDDEFRMLAANGLDDRLIAGHFGVPPSEVLAKREDLALRPR